MRLKFETFPELFNSICHIAETKDQTAYDEYKSNKTKTADSKQFEDFSSISFETYSLRITPILYLAYQGKHDAVSFLLKNDVDRSQALFGYALSGNTHGIYSNLENCTDDTLQNICIFLTYGNFFKYIFELYHYPKHDLSKKNVIIQGLSIGLGRINIAQTKQSMLYWMIKHIEFNFLFPELLSSLKSKNIINYDNSSLIFNATELNERYSFPVLVFRPQLYVWILQAPKSMEPLPLPGVLIFHIASFLGATIKDVNTITTNIKYIKVKNQLLIKLKSILKSEKSFVLFFNSELQDLCQKLIGIFTPINDYKLLSQSIKTQCDSLGKNSLLGKIFLSQEKQTKINEIKQALNTCCASLPKA